ncbi:MULTISPECIES: 23S rRNA pseudouridine(2605) synthase RluB [Bacillus]|uniref:Pseudouridine synthase n=3 Tax=Bacillus subtilis TaxID=1423 RepID=A0A0C3KKU8_BACIU|nr:MULTISPECIES: 23S rRNA pseudouridine(2605) synthase RluB [Bacillus]AYK68064.1 rRNA pseudouridine synthase [Bacillus subtilis subsp. subtilis]KIL33281.1 Ribosomal large subunit pseudouridine synthase B [Bacillus subtilis subsp. subtilis]KIN30655.1 Ribosomal large subunit pseudouridine synthase B [Bacillus subtilis]KIN31925.1 Ribosomal large subunit pseudouridine synthase B [Bacillus subtilis]KIN37220.1 Ribosomal large subunit pseudouridine synthase B [Bacillus subtilis]
MERLQKVIAHAGVASRRKAEELIKEGKVKVNGKVVTELGVKVTGSDQIEVNGLKVEREEPVYFLLYKPRGVISAVQDDKGRKVVTDFFKNIPQRIYPIGRLDYDTSGLLLLTNDGEFANKLMHPKYEIDKTYVAKVKGIPPKELLRKLERGIRLEEGKTAPAKAKLLSLDKKKQTSIIQLTIHEGRNRQVRRMFEAIGHEVIKLKREEYAFLNLRGLHTGDARELTPHEVKRLRALADHGKNAF